MLQICGSWCLDGTFSLSLPHSFIDQHWMRRCIGFVHDCRKKWDTFLDILVIWIYWTENCTEELTLIPRIFRWNYVIFATKISKYIILNTQIIYFQFKDLHVPFKTLQSISFKFFAKTIRGSCVFCCSSCIRFNPTSHLKQVRRIYFSIPTFSRNFLVFKMASSMMCM